MSDKMKALLRPSREPGILQLVELPVPHPEPGQILARVAYGGICGSDLDILNDLTPIYQPPVVPGHEFSAVIEAVGSDVAGFKAGDKVVSETVCGYCGQCQSCQNADYHLCLKKRILGWNENGGFGQYVVLHPRFTHKLSDKVDLRAAALAEPTAIAAEAVHVKGRLVAGESVAVIGPGTTGLLAALLAQSLGASQVFLIGRQSALPFRFPIARELGLEHCINSSDTDPLDYILKANHNLLPDLVIDSTGTLAGFNTALELVRRNGRIVELGSITAETPFPWPKAAWKALDLRFVFSSSGAAWQKVVEVYNAEIFDPTRLVTGVFPLDQYQAAYDTAAHADKGLKTLFAL